MLRIFSLLLSLCPALCSKKPSPVEQKTTNLSQNKLDQERAENEGMGVISSKPPSSV